MRPVIFLFAKAPVPGRVKTRLSERLGADAAARLHEAFAADMLDTLQSITRCADIELHTDTETDAWRKAEVSRNVQCEGDLGARMYNALDAALRSGRPAAMVVGSDAPTLPASHLERLLGLPGDVALGPTEDGGYYAISCRRVHPGMFHGVTWSKSHTLEETVRALQARGLSVELGPPWFDVDTPSDLDGLIAAGDLPRNTAEALRLLGVTGPALE